MRPHCASRTPRVSVPRRRWGARSRSTGTAPGVAAEACELRRTLSLCCPPAGARLWRRGADPHQQGRRTPWQRGGRGCPRSVRSGAGAPPGPPCAPTRSVTARAARGSPVAAGATLRSCALPARPSSGDTIKPPLLGRQQGHPSAWQQRGDYHRPGRCRPLRGAPVRRWSDDNAPLRPKRARVRTCPKPPPPDGGSVYRQ
jgi:hypothetical protein